MFLLCLITVIVLILVAISVVFSIGYFLFLLPITLLAKLVRFMFGE